MAGNPDKLSGSFILVQYELSISDEAVVESDDDEDAEEELKATTLTMYEFLGRMGVEGSSRSTIHDNSVPS